MLFGLKKRKRHVESVTLTHEGLKRKENEDSYLADSELGLWIVADGMGGHLAGEFASHITVETIHDLVKHGKSLVYAINVAHKRVLSEARADASKKGMGTTVVALKLDGDDYEIAWVGDSRAYLWDEEGLRLLTKDHSVVQKMIDLGKMTEAEAFTSPMRSRITQAVGSGGGKPIKPETVSGRLHKGEKILLCSDGLTDLVRDGVIEDRLGDQALSADACAEMLMNDALASGGTDNITIAILAPGRGFARKQPFWRRKSNKAASEAAHQAPAR